MSQPSDPQLEPPQSGEGASTSESNPGTPATGEAPKALTPEEQMALYEDDLKENDWGHQPC